MTKERPRTSDDMAALPEVGFGQEERVINGKRVLVPVAPDLVLFWSEDGDMVGYTDSDGTRWDLVKFADGSWSRQRAW